MAEEDETEVEDLVVEDDDTAVKAEAAEAAENMALALELVVVNVQKEIDLPQN